MDKKIDTLDNLPLNKTANVKSLNCTRIYKKKVIGFRVSS